MELDALSVFGRFFGAEGSASAGHAHGELGALRRRRRILLDAAGYSLSRLCRLASRGRVGLSSFSAYSARKT